MVVREGEESEMVWVAVAGKRVGALAVRKVEGTPVSVQLTPPPVTVKDTEVGRPALAAASEAVVYAKATLRATVKEVGEGVDSTPRPAFQRAVEVEEGVRGWAEEAVDGTVIHGSATNVTPSVPLTVLTGRVELVVVVEVEVDTRKGKGTVPMASKGKSDEAFHWGRVGAKGGERRVGMLWEAIAPPPPPPSPPPLLVRETPLG